MASGPFLFAVSRSGSRSSARFMNGTPHPQDSLTRSTSTMTTARVLGWAGHRPNHVVVCRLTGERDAATAVQPHDAGPAVEGGEHQTDATVLPHVRDRLYTAACVIDPGHLVLPENGQAVVPSGQPLTCPSAASGAVATNHRGCAEIHWAKPSSIPSNTLPTTKA